MDCYPSPAKTCVLRMQLKCEPCQKKVKKLLRKIHGENSISINAEEGTVTISSSTVDPRLFIAMLAKAGKKAELLWELPQQAPVNNPNPQVEQPFKNEQMAPPSPRPPPAPLATATSLQANNPNPQVEQAFKNVQMAPPSPRPPSPPLAPATNLQASGFDHVQLQELAKIPGLKHMELHHSRNINLVFKDHNDDLCHGKNYTPQMCKGAANVEAPTRSGHGHVTKNMHENSSREFEFSCGAGPSMVGNRYVEEQHMRMKPLVYYGPSPVRYYAHPFATPPDYYSYGGPQPTTLPHSHFNCSNDDGKCIVM